ncbi:DNA-directed RNA polymerase subunit beta [Denitrobacterium detoxificans]|uniref:DNA-directed RNA polymerase subunit beta n=2 Tax=Denitrobacterium detoxificans TaxID=79604 RepID=A0A172RWX9_9ACTN|nr:DNA-directed RNA polymerase subunit beta [Denitrobacterium detoxificans]ANE22155.1 DNA-directed RNA polymerase subunit beta [Denitrobacterium detoxificans]SEO84077.1 DNA-directed RNA polymerase subunit beta [Denitrobacterium detoxificans]
MAKAETTAPTSLYRSRRSFAKIPSVMDVPNLIAIQTESFDWFTKEGLDEAFKDICPIESNTKDMRVEIGGHSFGEPKYSVDECKRKDVSYQAPLFAEVRFTNLETGEIKEQDVFMGDFPLMTPRGTFIINGTERVVVSQLVRSPGVYFGAERDKTSNKTVYNAKIIPSRGAWLEFETDKRDILSVRIDRKRKQPATLLVRALGLAETHEEIVELLGDSEMVLRTLDRDPATTRDESLIELYKRFRPGEPPTIDSARTLLDGLFFNQQRYNLARVGRYKINKKLGFDSENDSSTLTKEDILASMRYIVALHDGEEGYVTDDIDHFGNRRIRTVGELIQNQFRIGLSRMERVVRERMSMQEPDDITPQSLINIRPIVAAIKEFFGSSQLSQFMDQSNPAAGITHKRRLSALGPGGLSRERAGFEVRDVHNSHYGRMCPIETPEGPNIGLIGSLATYGRVNSYGFIESPYRRVENGKVTDDVEYLTADEEEKHTIAQANEPFDPETRVFGHKVDGKFVPATRILARTRNSRGEFGDPSEVPVDMVDYMDVSPRQMVSVATSLIPFLEHDDCNRALMGSNMQRQAVPLLNPHAPLVGTGIEHRIAVDSGEILVAQNPGIVDYVDGEVINVLTDDGEYDEYLVPKFQRSNQGYCMNHKPIVRKGDRVQAGDVLADGPSCDTAELALGQNLMIAYMPWEGYNYEDAIIISERVVAEDLLTSINISEYEVDARDTKLGPEEITREIPNISEDMTSDLDADGIIRIGAEVHPGDVLVGKVTPKGETELTAEERLLRAIFGEKAREVRDTSLKVPHGSGGRVIDIQRFSAENGDELAPGVNEQVRVFVAQKRKVQQGDKLSGRHGNKGVISNVLPVEDMPYLADGTPIDVMLNPLGVPSRMNVGQLLECHLGWAAKWGWSDEENSDDAVDHSIFVSTPVFDGATEEEIADVIQKANRNLINIHRKKYGDMAREEFVPQLNSFGKTTLYDGRTGEPFREPITVGFPYILKLGHMVDDKIHARSTGPYSLITQQPLGGKAQFGGQRFGEMEVWALYAYGASNVLQEILTIKSDDTIGRVKSYESIVKGENLPAAEVPESFKVLVKEMRSLCLNVELEGEQGVIDVAETHEPEDDDSKVLAGMVADAKKTESEEDGALDAIAADLAELLSDDLKDGNDFDITSEGEER